MARNSPKKYLQRRKIELLGEKTNAKCIYEVKIDNIGGMRVVGSWTRSQKGKYVLFHE